MRAFSIVPLLWALTMLVVVGSVAGVLWWRLDPGGGFTAPVTPEPAGPTTIPYHRDYYVWVKLVELTPKMPSGSKWDMDGSAPDIRFRLWWKGNLVQVSTTRRDALIAKWDLLAPDILEILRSGGTVEISSVMTMPIVRIEPGMTLGIVVDDNDVGNGELAANFEIPLDRLKAGENELPGPTGSGVVRVVVQMIDVHTSANELAQLAMLR